MAQVVFRNVRKTFPKGVVAVQGLDLEIPEGELFILVGPSGCGKTTILRLMAGLARPTGGSLQVAGEPAHKPQARARVGLVGHASFLYPQLTARENLAFAARLQAVPDYAARAAAAALLFTFASVRLYRHWKGPKDIEE